MHYFAVVVVAPDTTIENAEERVTPILAPYDENTAIEQVDDGDGDAYWHNPRGKWDWWQVGGRWCGVASGYKPEEDPANVETCFLCNGGGLRMDALGVQQREVNPDYTCNGCRGNGERPKWSSKWAPHAGDVFPVDRLLDDPSIMRPHDVVVPDGGWHSRETWIPGTGDEDGYIDTVPDDLWSDTVQMLLKPCRGYNLVVIDYHA